MNYECVNDEYVRNINFRNGIVNNVATINGLKSLNLFFDWLLDMDVVYSS